MHIDLVSVQLQPNRMDEFVNVWKETLPLLLKPREGFQGAYLLKGSEADQATVVGMWESGTQSDAWQGSEAYQQYRAALGPYVAGPPTPQGYEVLAEI